MNEVNLSGPAVLVIGSLLTALGTVITFLFKLLLKSKDDQFSDIRLERDNYRNIATEAINLLEDSVEVPKLKEKMHKAKDDEKTK